MQPGEEDLYFEWTYAQPMPRRPTPPGFELWEAEHFFAELEKRTEGRFKTKFAWGIAGSQREMPFLISSGVNDMGGVTIIVAPAEFALLTMNWMFGWATGDLEMDQKLAGNIAKHPLAQANLDKMNLALGHWGAIPTFRLLLSKRVGKIETAADLKGLQLGTGKPGEPLWAKALGMVPVDVHITEMYEAMQKGVMDMAILDMPGAFGMKLDELVGSIVDIDMGGGGGLTVVNKDKWNSLPQYIKDLWWEIEPTAYSGYAREIIAARQQAALDICKAKGIELHKLPPAEEAKLYAAMEPVWGAWVAEQEGYPTGTQVKEYLKDQIVFRDKLTGQPWTIYKP
jgi:TRAP-type C4-dicarboxylate transport system substrate-binding protein